MFPSFLPCPLTAHDAALRQQLREHELQADDAALRLQLRDHELQLVLLLTSLTRLFLLPLPHPHTADDAALRQQLRNHELQLVLLLTLLTRLFPSSPAPPAQRMMQPDDAALRQQLRDHELQRMLLLIDSSPHPEAALEAARSHPAFTKFLQQAILSSPLLTPLASAPFLSPTLLFSRPSRPSCLLFSL
ncbi:unnamed protein product [Closterium sp. Naga37s-1]|nr:unnamed protein product [Closterium sp. Naga37s-1]